MRALHFTQFARPLLTIASIFISGISITQGETVVLGEWTDWGSWSDCTRPCGLGVHYRSRQCKAGTSVGSARGKIRFECKGDTIQYSTCNTQECADKRDFRAEQCSAFNKKDFHGKTFVWKPYLTSRPCELSCKARGRSFYVKLANKVKDGTRCSTDGSAVCVDGLCKAVGCDGVLGSNKVLDKCGVCGGHSDSCKIVQGRFTKSELPYGYNEVTILPRGACHINITELEYSRNYLALKVVATGKFIFNSNWRIDYNGEFKATGTVFKYMRPSNRYKPYNEHVLAQGPLTEAVALFVLYQQRNPGVVYEYTIPGSGYSGVVATSPEHSTSVYPGGRTHQEKPQSKDDSWNQPVTGPTLTQFSRTTEPSHNRRRHHRKGHQKPRVSLEIRQEASRRAAGASLAQQQGKLYQISASIAERARKDVARTYGPTTSGTNTDTGPTHTNTRPTNTNPPETTTRSYVNAAIVPQDSSTRWSYGTGNLRRNFGDFGGGTSREQGGNSRTYGGTSRGYDGSRDQTGGTYGGESREVDSYGSPYSPRYEWRVSGFTECTKTCGGGVQNSRVICVVRSSLAVVTDENCNPRSKPRPQTITCNNNVCPARWQSGTWGGCTVTCGEGSRRRRVECRQSGANNADLSVSANRCAGLPKPAVVESCEMAACFKWKIGQWGMCSSRCGRGTQRRDVYCADHKESKVREHYCSDLDQPEREQSCQSKPCNSGWMYSTWADQCSADCGSGHYVRDVLCAARSGCNQENKPEARRACRDGNKCGAQWFTGPWSQCSDSCKSSSQTRTAVCMISVRGALTVVNDTSCDSTSRPEVSKPCQEGECSAKWFMTQWSECSATCGEDAVRTRVVQCLTRDQRVANTCDQQHRPPSKRTCQTAACPTPPPLDPGCRDLMSRCMMVVRARLCTYKYYKQRCCHSCTRYEDILERRRERIQQQYKSYS